MIVKKNLFPRRLATVCALCIVALAGFGKRVAAASTDPARPNILFIVCDDLRTELGCYGSQIAKTPNLDALASKGVVFDRAYAQQALCSPSRTSFMTGLRPDSTRVWDLDTRFRQTRPNVKTLPEYLKDNGYFTEGIGKIFHNQVNRDPGKPPFPDPPSWSVPPLFSTGAHWEDWVVLDDPFGPKEKAGAWQCVDVPDEDYKDGQIAACACTTIQTLANSDKPFFLAVGFWKPHLPFNAPKKYWDLYDPKVLSKIPLTGIPENSPPIAHHDWKELRSYGGIPKQGPLTSDEITNLRHGYLASVSFLDTNVGKVLDQLKASGLDKNTIIVFFSDHGYHLGEQDLWAKTSNYELDDRVPLIVVDPRKHVAGHADGIVELVDLFPTLVDLAGVQPPSDLEGESLAPFLKDPSHPGKPYAVSQHPEPFYSKSWKAMGYALRTKEFRYVEWFDLKSGKLFARELYDDVHDPLEMKNVVDDPQYQAEAQHMADLAKKAYHYDPKIVDHD